MTVATEPSLRRLGDVKDAAVMLDMSVKTVRRLIDRGQLPGVVRIGRLVRVDLALLSHWIDQACPPLHKFASVGSASPP